MTMSRRCAGSICKCRRDRSSASSAGTAPARRRRSRCCSGWRRPSRGEARVFGHSPSGSDSGVEIRRRTAFVSDEKDLYDYMTVGEIVAFTRSFYPRWRGDLEQQYLRKFDLSPSRDIKDAVARHAHEAGDAAGALPRRRAADPRRADVGPRSGDGGRDAAGARRPRRRRRIDGVLLVASARRSRADRRSRRDHRSRPDRRRRRARRSARAVSAHPAGVREQRARDQGACAGHASRAPPGARAHGALLLARRRRDRGAARLSAVVVRGLAGHA